MANKLNSNHRKAIYKALANNSDFNPVEWDYLDTQDFEKYSWSGEEVDSSDENYPFDERVIDLRVKPIRIENNFTGDIYDIYYKHIANAWTDRQKDSYYKEEEYERGDGLWKFIDKGSLKGLDSFEEIYDKEKEVLVVPVKKGIKFSLGADGKVDVIEGKISEVQNLEKFEDVDAPDYSVIYGDDPQVSVAEKLVNIDALVESQIEKAQKKVQEAIKQLADLKKAKDDGSLETAMWTFDEVDELYNSQISTYDKRAFFMWLQNKCQKKLTGDFNDKYGCDYPAPALDIIELLKRGVLFFDITADFGERLQPKVIYQSGNIWRKWQVLSAKKEEYVKRFGEKIYQNHIDTLEPTWKKIWEKRLRVGGEDKDMRAIILPNSEIAQTFKIEKYKNPKDANESIQNFQIRVDYKKNKPVFDVANLEGKYKDSNMMQVNALSLKDAFISWLRDAGGKSSEYGIIYSKQTPSLAELMQRYLKPLTNNPYAKQKGGKDKWLRQKDDARKVGERLFSQFLYTAINRKDQQKLEFIFNSTFINYHEPNLDEVPIGFTYKKYLDNLHLFILREFNLRAIRYYLTRGSVGLAYGVGIGKTFCSIFCMKQSLDLGIVKRPLVIVPNQVYFQFGQEIERGLGQEFDPKVADSRLNMFYNGSGLYSNKANNGVDGINLGTYEATKRLFFDKSTTETQDGEYAEWLSHANLILEQGGNELDEDITADLINNNLGSIFHDFENLDSDESEVLDMEDGGKVKKKQAPITDPIFVNSDTTKYDMIVVDEAHNFNKLFLKVVSAPKSEQTKKRGEKGTINIQRPKHEYSSIRETKGRASGRARKLWYVSQYIQSLSPMKNTILLSATPFTNSPLEVYSLLAMLDFDFLFKNELGIIKDFFDLFAKIEYSEDFKTDLTPVKRNKLVGWRNLIGLQNYIYHSFDKSSRDDEDKAVKRPKKIVLPLKRDEVDGQIFELPKENKISTTIKLSEKQQGLWNRVREFASPTGIEFADLCSPENQSTTNIKTFRATRSSDRDDDESAIDNPDNLSDGSTEGEKAKDTAKAIQCLIWGREIALNPYLFQCSGYKVNPTYKEYVEASPKLVYIMKCIESVRNYHLSKKEEVSGQVIYMNYGVKTFPLLRDYLVNEVGYDLKEIGIISGSKNTIGKKNYPNKQSVADAFLGRYFDEKNQRYIEREDKDRVKVLIGTDSIKEGINLQNYGSVLYNAFVDYNPTDQVQVEGRIWRQGNIYANCRIVIPLMEDSIDIFMFQKLQDKTERINQVWTRNGNKNELNTTAFNPEELKYELLTDPVAIANGERDVKVSRMEEEIAIEGEQQAKLNNIKALFTKSEQILSLSDSLANSYNTHHLLGMYFNISVLRCDLLDKPLYNATELINMAKYVWKTDAFNGNYPNLISSQSHLAEWFLSNGIVGVIEESTGTLHSFFEVVFGNNVLVYIENEYNVGLTSKAEEWKSKVFNYNIKDLIDLYVKINKEQKIAFPQGYSKNWRDLIPKAELPIIEGDIVEYDTKKGRKKGEAEYVVNSDGNIILHVAFDQFQDFADDDNATLKEGLKEVTPYSLQQFKRLREDAFILISEDATNTKKINNIIKLYKWWLENVKHDDSFYDNDGNLIGDYIPKVLDIGELEELSIENKNIVKVKDESKKSSLPKKTKYPDPYPYKSKDALNNLIDSYLYCSEFGVYYTDYDDMVINFTSIGNIDDELTNSVNFIYKDSRHGNKICKNQWQLLYSGYYGLGDSKDKEKVTENFTKEYKEFDSWDKLQQVKFKDGFYKFDSRTIYKPEYPLALADFERIKERELVPLGLETLNQVEDEIGKVKFKISDIELQKNLLQTDEQVFQELVQEVVRKQQEMALEEERMGSSYLSRAEDFATPNPDYLGNDVLSILSSEETERRSNVVDSEEIIEHIDESDESESLQDELQIEIDGLKEFLDVMDEEDRKETQELINELEEQLEFI